LKLYAKAMRLEKAIRQSQDLIKITRENNVTPADFRMAETVYKQRYKVENMFGRLKD